MPIGELYPKIGDVVLYSHGSAIWPINLAKHIPKYRVHYVYYLSIGTSCTILITGHMSNNCSEWSQLSAQATPEKDCRKKKRLPGDTL